MADEALPPNSLAPSSRARSTSAGDVPDAFLRRYYVNGRGEAGIGFYSDATVLKPTFRDHGWRLQSERSDPGTLRDLAAIAQHRGWSVVVARGAKSFRREAWLNGRTIGLDVRGYRPTERDLQELDRRIGRRTPRDVGRSKQTDSLERDGAMASDAVQATLRIVEAVVRSRVAGEPVQARILQRARSRVVAWLERGASFPPLQTKAPAIVALPERRRDRGL